MLFTILTQPDSTDSLKSIPEIVSILLQTQRDLFLLSTPTTPKQVLGIYASILLYSNLPKATVFTHLMYQSQQLILHITGLQ